MSKNGDMPRIIGLAGHMAAGKDLSASILKRLGYARAAHSDALRREVECAVRINMAPPSMPREMFMDLMAATPSEVWSKPTSDRMRRILQFWGTEFRRAEDPDYWVKRVDEFMSGDTKYVISDVRFINEAELVWKRGGEVWRIDRGVPADKNLNHISEAMGFPVDRVIDNRGTVEHLEEQLYAALNVVLK